MNKKHAYLIIAHKNDYCFKTLLQLLDDDRNDIYIHMDAKCQDYIPAEAEQMLSHSSVYHIKRQKVTWGGYSMIQVEIKLIEKATSIGKYQYYHLLSGQDLPIKSQNYIHDFFDSNNGKEFVLSRFPVFSHPLRVSFYHLFQERLGRKQDIFLNRLFLKCQKLVGIKRNRHVSFFKGPQWFSITDEFARYVVSQKKWVNNVFRFTFCCDEVFLQTLLMNSPYKCKRYWVPADGYMHSIMRLIDWERGKPYIFRMSDIDEIKNSDMLFCRKFDSDIDSDIITFIKDTYEIR